ncbi:hypothetical protein CEUSTIGMA_g471.t1 [Chlamydomonas eustigma]|uniref:Uncharacterized protein n=1 Tax=Chlamydomonas eustigma TaxID=1157962 RepID=A0A250WQP9_9CHLO|nr:hypothetical protein CEUSTIGMA_g471.t1 [Chlamydomonas eustigma]|eukprot:GAX73019.1 hypothetical protein CEUSTIGMA_g471.t1 [Chlamydomonas eustigma]
MAKAINHSPRLKASKLTCRKGDTDVVEVPKTCIKRAHVLSLLKTSSKKGKMNKIKIVDYFHRPQDRKSIPLPANVTPHGWQATFEEGPPPLGEVMFTKQSKSKRQKLKTHAGLSAVYKGNVQAKQVFPDDWIAEDSPEELEKMEQWLLHAKHKIKFHEVSEGTKQAGILS